CHVALKADKPKSANYPKTLKTIGDHIRRKRLQLGLFQRQVARDIGVDESTLFNWERNKVQPQIHYLARILEFLGYSHSQYLYRLQTNCLTLAERAGLPKGPLRSGLGSIQEHFVLWREESHQGGLPELSPNF